MLSWHKMYVFSFKDKTNKIDEKAINGYKLYCYVIYYIILYTCVCVYVCTYMYTHIYVYIAE